MIGNLYFYMNDSNNKMWWVNIPLRKSKKFSGYVECLCYSNIRKEFCIVNLHIEDQFRGWQRQKESFILMRNLLTFQLKQ
jgi:hypothetical protein